LTDILIPEQAFIRMPSPILSGSKEFKERVCLYRKIDEILVTSGIETQLKRLMVEREIESRESCFEPAEQLNFQRKVSFCLRANIARTLSKGSFRRFAVELADSNTLQWFCGYDSPRIKKILCRSHLHSLSKFIPEEIINEITAELSRYLSTPNSSLLEPFDLSSVFMDSTCVKLKIHHPIDWVLLKDAIKSIMTSIKCIRKHGIKHRINPPDDFIKKANKIAMAMTMTQSIRKGEAKKTRKNLFRELKALLRIVEDHGCRYLTILQNKWAKTGLSEKQAEKISIRLINILDQVDQIIHQAHERLIGERSIQNKDKILSLHQKHAKVYKRGKAGADVEFGLQLFIAESEKGLIINWNLRNGQPQHDSKFIKPCVDKLITTGLMPKMMSGDRGFVSKKSSDYLKKFDIKNQICPKNKTQLKIKLKTKAFRDAANRRSQTEGRIGILKNEFLGGALKTDGFESQHTQISWAVLTHNLWVAARKCKWAEDDPIKIAA